MLDDGKQLLQAGHLQTSRKPGLGLKYLEEEQIPNSTDDTGKIIPFPICENNINKRISPSRSLKKNSIF